MMVDSMVAWMGKRWADLRVDLKVGSKVGSMAGWMAGDLVDMRVVGRVEKMAGEKVV